MKEVDFSEYNKPPFLPGWMNKEETLVVAKTPDKQLAEFNKAVLALSNQFSKDYFISNTELLNRRGRLLGIERNGSDNETYYKQQELRILLNLNKSTIPDIIRILKTYYSAEVIHIQPNYPAGITILHDGLSPVGVDFNSFIKETIGAGIAYETRELYVFKELLLVSDKRLGLGFKDFDELHYCGLLNYNGVATYGGQHWEQMLYDGTSRYNSRDESDGLKRIRTEFIKIKDDYVLKYIPKDKETGWLVLGDYNLNHQQAHTLFDAGEIADESVAQKLIFGDVDYSGKITYNGAVSYGTNRLENKGLKAVDTSFAHKQKHSASDTQKMLDTQMNHLQGEAGGENAGLLADIVNLRYLYYSYLGGAESYNGDIQYGPKIEQILS